MYITSQRLRRLNMVILEEEFYSYLLENCFFTPFLSIVFFFKHSYIETKLSQFFLFVCIVRGLFTEQGRSILKFGSNRNLIVYI
jgi:hypothetical protein